MSSPWNIAALRSHIQKSGELSNDLVRILDSVGRYVDIFRYHMLHARDAMKAVVVENDPYGIENTRYVLGASERQEEYARAKIASEANILGCIHSSRALLDVFAFLVNGLLLGARISPRRCDIKTVAAALPDSPLRQRLQVLIGSSWFGYVSAFVNTAKHRQLVPHGFWVSFETGAAGIRLEGFEYEGVRYNSYTAEELLRGVIEVKNSVVDSGKLLNQLVLGGTT
jgi:hypothetical protein